MTLCDALNRVLDVFVIVVSLVGGGFCLVHAGIAWDFTESSIAVGAACGLLSLAKRTIERLQERS